MTNEGSVTKAETPLAAETYAYQQGPEIVAKLGRMMPFGDRVLVRAIMAEDSYRGPLYTGRYNSTDAAAFEIVEASAMAVAYAEKNGLPALSVGRHCDIRSVAADRVEPKNPSGRFWLVRVEDIAAVWDPVEVTPDVMALCEQVRNDRASVPVAPAITDPILVPGR